MDWLEPNTKHNLEKNSTDTAFLLLTGFMQIGGHEEGVLWK